MVSRSTRGRCLSTPGGKVRIDWCRNERQDLILNWSETGGRPVRLPSRKGFGTTIIERSVPYDLGGTATIDYAPTGVTASFCIPGRHVSEPKNFAGPAIRFPRSSLGHPQPPPDKVLLGRNVLVVEDSLIIALDAEDIVGRLGAETVLTAATVDSALDQLHASRPDIAILDINLGDRNSFAIADRLLDMNVPFLFATGYGEQAQIPMEHRGRLVVQKPYTIENVARAVETLLGSAGSPGPD